MKLQFDFIISDGFGVITEPHTGYLPTVHLDGYTDFANLKNKDILHTIRDDYMKRLDSMEKEIHVISNITLDKIYNSEWDRYDSAYKYKIDAINILLEDIKELNFKLLIINGLLNDLV